MQAIVIVLCLIVIAGGTYAWTRPMVTTPVPLKQDKLLWWTVAMVIACGCIAIVL